MGDLKITIQCIKDTPVTVIAGERKAVDDLVNAIISNPEARAKLLPSDTVKDIEEKILADKDGLRIICCELSVPVDDGQSKGKKRAHIIEELVKLAEKYDINIVATLPNCNRADCRSAYFYIPDDKRNMVRGMVLSNNVTHLQLTIEHGLNYGEYICYDYNCGTGEFKEKTL